jgi:broad specificity phosphatase PhoE
MMEYKTEEKYIFAFVGLPARGKSYLSKKIASYLNWIDHNCKIFSIGVYRRSIIGVNYDVKFFEENEEMFREKCVKRAIDDLVDYLFNRGGKVAIIDGTNTTTNRRRMIEEYLHTKINSNINLMWIEPICDCDNIIEQNIFKTKLKSPDYLNWDKEEAVHDFRERIKMYEKEYEHLSPERDGEKCSYIQMINRNKEIITRNVRGFIESKVLSLLVNLHPGEKPIYFTRHGESEYNIFNIIGGDPGLTENGMNFSKGLLKFFLENEENNLKKSYYSESPIIFSSTMKRAVQTAENLKTVGKVVSFKCLDELNVGIYDGLTYEEIIEKHPKEAQERDKDKLNYRYPRGESYKDLIHRIEPVIFELERRAGPVIVVGHQATLRCLYGYFTQTPLEEIPHLNVPLHTVIRFVPEAFGYEEERFFIDPDTHKVTPINKDQAFKFEAKLYNLPSNY